MHSTEILISRNVKFFDLEFPFHSYIVHLVPYTHIYIENQVHSLSNQQHEVHDNSTSNPEVDTDTASKVEQPDAVIG